jgi:hypothetical protein
VAKHEVEGLPVTASDQLHQDGFERFCRKIIMIL